LNVSDRGRRLASQPPEPGDYNSVEAANKSKLPKSDASEHSGISNAERANADGAPGEATKDWLSVSERQEELNERQQSEVEDLEKRDRAVRVQAQAAKDAGGNLAGPVNLTFERGPDGRTYAVDGSVAIDVFAVKDPITARIDAVRSAEVATERFTAMQSAPTETAPSGLKVTA
jgi:hypothetical protein